MKTKEYRTYRLRYEDPVDGIITGTVEGLCSIQAENETQLIGLFHKAVKDKMSNKPIQPNIVSPAVSEILKQKKEKIQNVYNKNYSPEHYTNPIAGDVIAPRLADIFLVDECKVVYVVNKEMCKIVSIDEEGFAHFEDITKASLAADYKIISRLKSLRTLTSFLDAQSRSKSGLLEIRKDMETDIDQLDKDPDQVYSEFIEFIQNSGDLTDLQKEQYLTYLR